MILYWLDLLPAVIILLVDLLDKPQTPVYQASAKALLQLATQNSSGFKVSIGQLDSTKKVGLENALKSMMQQQKSETFIPLSRQNDSSEMLVNTQPKIKLKSFV